MSVCYRPQLAWGDLFLQWDETVDVTGGWNDSRSSYVNLSTGDEGWSHRLLVRMRCGR